MIHLSVSLCECQSHLGGLFQRLDGLVLLLELGPVVMQVVHALRRAQLPMQPTMPAAAAAAPLGIMILEMALQGRRERGEGISYSVVIG